MRKVRDGLYIGNITDAAAVLSSVAADSSRRLSPATAAVTHLLSLISRGINPLDFKRPAHIPDPDEELQQAAGEQPCTPIPSSSSSSSSSSSPASSPGNSKLKKLTVPLLDSQSQNLLDHLDECLEFIESGRKDGGIVLVHCFAGVSRRQATKPSSSASSSSSPILPLFYYISSWIVSCFGC
jgi:dual specificity phosphatase 12